MRILWLSPWLRPTARVFTEGLQALGAEVMLVTSDLHPESDWARPYETVLLGRPLPTADWRAIAAAYRAASRFKPDIVVTELLRDPRWRLFAQLAPRVRLIHDDRPHDATHKPPWWNRLFFQNWDARADATVVFSSYVAENFRQHSPLRMPVFVAPLVSDLHPDLCPEFVPAEDRSDFLLVGRQRPYKNHHVVFAAWEAHTQGPAWRGDQLVLYGNGELSCPLPAHVQWHRDWFKYSDVATKIAHAKGSIVHCRTASQSGVQVLSMQLGVPTLVSSAGALPEYQPPNMSVSGIDDIHGLTLGFDSLSDPAVVAIQAKSAVDHYQQHYSQPVATARLLTIFEKVAGCVRAS